MRAAILSLAMVSSVGADPQRGVALGLFGEDSGWSYRPLLEEIRALGANHVELVVAWYLEDGQATEVYEHPRFSAPAEAIARAIGDAHALGLKVLLFPILRLEHPKGDEWRGTLRPRDRGALFTSYGRALIELARLAERERAEQFSVGSELSTLDGDRPAWSALIARVRAVYRGPLIYSGNWDHFDQVAFYDQLDFVGVCGYFALADQRSRATDEDLVQAWRRRRAELTAFAQRIGRPLVLTEVGYLSQRGAAAWPWAEGAHEPVDLEEQRRCYAAFRRAWRWAGAPFAGVYFWNWYGWGGVGSRGYTPRGKPAEREIRQYFRFGTRL